MVPVAAEAEAEVDDLVAAEAVAAEAAEAADRAAVADDLVADVYACSA